MTHPWKHEPREFLTNNEKVELFKERGGRCHRCTRKLYPGDLWIVEHIVALQNGGTNDWANLDVTGIKCCLKEKNAEDAAKAAKMRAVAVSTYLPTSEKKSKGRPMPGTKRSGLKKRMDGTVERRS